MKRPLIITTFSLILVLALYLGITANLNQVNKKVPLYGPVSLKETPSNLSENRPEEAMDKPNQADALNFEMTKDPALGYPPVERKQEVTDYIQKKFNNKIREATAIGGVEWVSRGPGNIGGRTKALMFDPNDANAKKVFAGSSTGGLWVNDDITDPNMQWQNVSTIVDNLTITAMTYDPSNKQVFYIGTGTDLFSNSNTRGEGIWKSTDGGVNWTRLSGTINSSFYYVNRMAVTSSGTVLAATANGLFRSIDAGATWTEAIEGPFSDIEIASDNTIYTAGGMVTFEGAIYKSTNDGADWKTITPAPLEDAERIELATAPSNPNRIYAVAGVFPDRSDDIAWIKKSNDGGQTWFDLEIPFRLDQDCSLSTTSHFTNGQAWFDLTLTVHPENQDIVILGGIDLLRTTNGGSSWEPISYWVSQLCPQIDYVHPDQHAFVFRPGYPNEGISGSDGGISYSANVGANNGRPIFNDHVRNYATTQLYSVAMDETFDSDFFIMGAQDNGTILIEDPGLDGGRLILGGDGAYTFIDKDDPNVYMSSFTFNDYILTTDGGKSYSNIINQPNTGRFINPAEYDQDAKVLYTAGDADQYLRVTDITTSPSNPLTNTVDLGNRQITVIKASPHTENRIFVGVRAQDSESHIFMIDNAHQSNPTVTDISGTMEGTIGEYVSSIEVGESDDQLILTFSNYGVTSIYETLDGGTNWTSKEGNLPDMPVRWAIYNPNNRKQVLIATEMGVWSTDDFSVTPDWDPTNNGMASVRTSMIRYRASDQQIAIATFGRGVYTSNVFATTPVAEFKAKTTIGYVGKPVQFEDASVLSGDSWAWTFGDGESSSLQNPSHTYETPGVYDVSLTTAAGAKNETKTAYITIMASKSTPYLPADGGDFESNGTDWASTALVGGINVWERGTPSNTVDTPSSGVNAWKTDLDANLPEPEVDYVSALYSPLFDFSDDTRDYGLKFNMSGETQFCNAPFAMKVEYSTDLGATWQRLGNSIDDFGSENWYWRGPDQQCDIATRVFTDFYGWAGGNVENLNTEYALGFLAGQPNVSFRFLSAGAEGFSGGYDVDGFMIDDFQITKSEAVSEFQSEQQIGYVGEDLQFTYESNGATSFLWEFGDGSSTERNPTHQYEIPGTYTVKLTVQTPGGEKVNTKDNYIKILPKLAGGLSIEDGGDFESNTEYFAADNIRNTPWERGNSSVAGKDGTASGSNAWVTGLEAVQYFDDSEAYLYTPAFSFDIVGEYTFEFDAKFEFEADWDGFIVEYSTDLGSSWTKLNDARASGWYNSTSDANNQIFGASQAIFSGSTGGDFDTFSTDVSDLFPNSYVSFRFLFRTDAATVDVGMALDNFRLLAPATGTAVPDFTVADITGCSGQEVVFTNASTGSVTSLFWDFGDNATPATATGAGPHEVTYSGEGLSTVSLTVTNPANESMKETKADFITTAATHSPSFTEEDNGDRDVARLIASDGDAYQWFFESEAIEGATSQILLAEPRGFYSVAVTVNGCTVTTSRLNVITATEDDPAFDKAITVFPNPVQDIATVRMATAKIGKVTLTIYDQAGKLISQQLVDKDKFNAEYQLRLGALEKNIYILEIISGDSRSVKRLIKE